MKRLIAPLLAAVLVAGALPVSAQQRPTPETAPAVLLVLFAVIPLIWSGHDYGLLIIIGSVMAGVTIESAIKASGRG